MRTIMQGSTGAAVSYAQGRLNRQGFGPLAVDGDFGPATHGSVLQFQAASDLVVDGIVGPKTWDALRVELRAPVPDRVRSEYKSHHAQENVFDAQGRAVEIALADLGAKENPDGSNNGPEIAHLVNGYAAIWQIPGGKDNQPWCAKAACVWTAEALALGRQGARVDWSKHPFGDWLGGVASIEDWAKKNNRFETDLSAMPAGAIYTMARGGSSSDPSTALTDGHCGIVVEDKGSSFSCVDGNVSNEVQFRVRTKDSVRGYVRWW